MKNLKKFLKQNRESEKLPTIAHNVVGSAANLGSFLNPKNLFLDKFNRIPNCIEESCIDMVKFKKCFDENYKSIIKQTYYKRRCFKRHEISTYDDVYYFLHKDILCYVNYNENEVAIYFNSTKAKYVKKLHKVLVSCISSKEISKPHVNIMFQSSHGLRLERLEIKETDLKVEEQYNDDFLSVDEIIKDRLNRDNDKGIVLLHGAPGTGKTTYIKHLISSVKKEVVFMPPNIAANVTNPALMTLMLENPNSILIIEDAENIITNRDHSKASAVSALLNLSDGILSDCLNMQIICSFNTDLKNVDKALLRKGRLIAKYEFSKLETSKANQLSEKLGFTTTFTEPQVLTDIYNQNEKATTQPLRKAIGFN